MYNLNTELSVDITLPKDYFGKEVIKYVDEKVLASDEDDSDY